MLGGPVSYLFVCACVRTCVYPLKIARNRKPATRGKSSRTPRYLSQKAYSIFTRINQRCVETTWNTPERDRYLSASNNDFTENFRRMCPTDVRRKSNRHPFVHAYPYRPRRVRRIELIHSQFADTRNHVAAFRLVFRCERSIKKKKRTLARKNSCRIVTPATTDSVRPLRVYTAIFSFRSNWRRRKKETFTIKMYALCKLRIFITVIIIVIVVPLAYPLFCRCDVITRPVLGWLRIRLSVRETEILKWYLRVRIV